MTEDDAKHKLLLARLAGQKAATHADRLDAVRELIDGKQYVVL